MIGIQPFATFLSVNHLRCVCTDEKIHPPLQIVKSGTLVGDGLIVRSVVVVSLR